MMLLLSTLSLMAELSGESSSAAACLTRSPMRDFGVLLTASSLPVELSPNAAGL